MVAAQSVERSLPTQEIRNSNPKIDKVFSTNCKLNREDENKKEAGNGSLLKKNKIRIFSLQPEFFRLVIQLLISVQTNFLIGAWSLLADHSLLLPAQHGHER